MNVHGRLKIILLGDSRVGKTMLISSFATGTFVAGHKPTQFIKKITYPYSSPSGVTEVEFWDTRGSLENYALRKDYFYRGTDGAIICFDLANRRTFSSLTRWLLLLQDKSLGASRIPILLVGTKADLGYEGMREVEEQEGLDFAEGHCFHGFVQLSSLYCTNVMESLLSFITAVKRAKAAEVIGRLAQGPRISVSTASEAEGKRKKSLRKRIRDLPKLKSACSRSQGNLSFRQEEKEELPSPQSAPACHSDNGLMS